MARSPTTPLPLAAEALGTITYAGLPADPRVRVDSSDTTVTIDNSLCFIRTDRDKSRYRVATHWVRLPGFFTLIARSDIEAINYLSLCYPGCATGDAWHGHWSFIDAQNGEIKDIELTATSPLATPTVDNALTKEILLFENTIEKRALSKADQLLTGSLEGVVHPRLAFAKGAFDYLRGASDSAKAHFYEAACYGHPDGFDAVVAANAQASKTFLAAYPEMQSILALGEPLRALTHLRTIKEKHPLHANILLAYALLKAGEPAEGLHACQTALSLDPLLPDVYGHRWSYLFHSGQDHEAHASAKEHLGFFPMDLRAYTDALDASILTGELEDAHWYSSQYPVQAMNLHTALKNLFKYYETTREWSALKKHFSTITPLLRAPTADTLTLHAETLIEVEEYEQAFKLLDQAMRAAPENVDTILAYCRGYARMGDFKGAIKLLSTVMNDPTRDDRTTDRFLMLSLLSELYRCTGDLNSAIAIWPDGSTFTAELLGIVGPRPLVEVAYCYAEAGAIEQAQQLLELLMHSHSDVYIVQELDTALTALVD